MKFSSLEIRPAHADDGGALYELVSTFPTPTPPTLEQFQAALDAKLATPDSFLGVAEQAGGLVGYAAGYRHPTFYAAPETAWLDELLVARDFRGHGIGRALMEAFEAWAQGHGCRLVGLATVGATAFYERLGYASESGYFKKYLE